MDIKGHEQLLSELRTEYPKAVLDGAVNEDSWSDLPKNRILWILKEVNDFPGDLRNLLNNQEELYKYSNWKATYGLVAKVSYGIFNQLEWGEWVENVDKLVKEDRILQKIAVINVNKCGGGSASDSKALFEAAEKFHDIIVKQIELLDPNVVILGGVNEFISKWLPEFTKGREVIIAGHPCRKTHQKYYESIINQ